MGVRISRIHQRENRWAVFLPSLPCSGSESGIHVSRGLVLDGVMGVSVRGGGWASVPDAREWGQSGTAQDPGPTAHLLRLWGCWAA